MLLKVYVETSVIGAYFEERNDVVSAAQCHWSRLWWDHISSQYDVIISEAVTNELAKSELPVLTRCGCFSGRYTTR